jgi:hypothetical protein
VEANTELPSKRQRVQGKKASKKLETDAKYDGALLKTMESLASSSDQRAALYETQMKQDKELTERKLAMTRQIAKENLTLQRELAQQQFIIAMMTVNEGTLSSTAKKFIEIQQSALLEDMQRRARESSVPDEHDEESAEESSGGHRKGV